MKITKFKWNWIKFWGYRYLLISPDSSKEEIIIYHRRIFKMKDWNNYFIQGGI